MKLFNQRFGMIGNTAMGIILIMLFLLFATKNTHAAVFLAPDVGAQTGARFRCVPLTDIVRISETLSEGGPSRSFTFSVSVRCDQVGTFLGQIVPSEERVPFDLALASLAGVTHAAFSNDVLGYEVKREFGRTYVKAFR